MTTVARTPSSPAPAVVPVARPRAGKAVRLRAFVELTKPRITLLLLVTCVAAMFCAARGVPDGVTLLVTALGLAMSSGGASALNHVFDRDIDAVMRRTSTRPVVTGVVGAAEGTVFGIGLMVAAGVLLWLVVNPLTALLALAGGLFYVLVYTMLLKRTTVQNIVIGGAAGAVPPLVGWAAVRNDVGVVAVVLFAIVFLWTPPHFWALALLIREEYARAKVPMLPVVAGERATARQILVYTVVLLVATLAPVATGDLGVVYGVAALVLGLRFVGKAAVLDRAARALPEGEVLVVAGNAGHAAARATFLYSMAYLALLFAAAVVDQAVVFLPLR